MTGFGLLIHAKEMADNQVTLLIDTEALPTITGALAYAAECLVTAGQRNRQTIGTTIDYSKISMEMQELLFDPQTSGGLLISVVADEAACLALFKRGPCCQNYWRGSAKRTTSSSTFIEKGQI